MGNIIKTKGIVLNEMTIKDSDKRIVIFSEDYGKMVVFANGAKRVKSPLLAGTQPFVFGEFSLYAGRDSYTLKSVEIMESFFDLRNNIDALYHGMYFLEVVGSVVQEEDPNVELLRLLYVTLKALLQRKRSDTLIKNIFEWRLLTTIGFAPDLYHCVKCGSQESFIDIHIQGGVICSTCQKTATRKLRKEVVELLRYVQSVDTAHAYAFDVKEEYMEEMKYFVHRYYQHFLPYSYKSLQMLEM